MSVSVRMPHKSGIGPALMLHQTWHIMSMLHVYYLNYLTGGGGDDGGVKGNKAGNQ